jgi:hypothetical protein
MDKKLNSKPLSRVATSEDLKVRNFPVGFAMIVGAVFVIFKAW